MSINKTQEQLFEVLTDEAAENLTGGETLYVEPSPPLEVTKIGGSFFAGIAAAFNKAVLAASQGFSS